MSEPRSTARGGPRLSRRELLQVGAAAGGALVITVHAGGCVNRSPARMVQSWKQGNDLVPSAWVKITPQSEVVLRLASVEMGQGTMTSNAMLLAEELEVDPATIRVELAPADRVYDNPKLGFQITGGSTSTVTSFLPLREAGAVARELLRRAAAEQWGVPLESCHAELGRIHHRPSGRQARYGELVERASQLPKPRVRLKPRSAFRVIGKSVGRLDARAKVDGSAIFGLDVSVPGMLHAVVIRCPVPGGRPRSFSAADALGRPGVRHVVGISRGVAVVADSYWQAQAAAAAVRVEWDEGKLAGFSTDAWQKETRKRAQRRARGVRRRGLGHTIGMRRADRVIRAEYEVPYLAHAPMEPMNCTARVTRDRCDVWAPTQSPGMAREVAKTITGLPYERVHIHQTFLGGGFGRRIPQDYVAEAVEISKQIGRPVKVVWSREEDLTNDYYRPATFNLLEGGLDKHGRVVAWFHRLVGQSILAQVGRDFLRAMAPSSLSLVFKSMVANAAAGTFEAALLADQTSIEGAADMVYDIPHVKVEYAQLDPHVPVGFWRSVGHSENGFIVESFIDELAAAARRDPYELRRELLAKAPRHRAVLDLAAEKAGWRRPAPPGIYRGIAQHKSFGTYVAQVAEVSVQGASVRVHRIVCAIDCGQVVNPDGVRAQVEGAVIFGLSAALKQAITFKDGRVEQSNFHDFPLLRMHECPVIEVHILDSAEPPSGVGETGVPPVAPAVANAIFAATGKRLRRLPLEPELRRLAAAAPRPAGT